MEEDDPHTIAVYYPAEFAPGYLRPVVRLEVGPLAAMLPMQWQPVQSYAAESFPQLFRETNVKVPTISIERTFWEKLTILHAEAHRPNGKPLPPRYARHYYDVHCLAKSQYAQKMLNSTHLLADVSALEEQIELSVLDVASRTLDKLREMAPELANELTPRFKDKPKWTFSFTLDGENGIPINKRGSGVRRLILLNFFRAEAEKAVAGSQRKVIYAIEEPETSQHPNYQIMLMNALLDLANQPDRQILVTTHVPALAGLVPIKGIRYVTKDEYGVPVVKMPDDSVLKEAAESLGVLPETGMERAKGIVLVEGKSDVTFLRHAAKTLKAAGHVTSSLDDAKIVPIPIGGCGSVKHWVTLNLADDLGLPWCVFLDSDIGGRPEQILKRKEEVEGKGHTFYSTRKREIENYLCPELVKTKTGIEVKYTDTCDAKKIIGGAVGSKSDDVIDRFWPHMCAERMIDRSSYDDNGIEKSELVELTEKMLALVKP